MNRPLSIVYVSREYPPETAFGGIATYTSTAAKALAGRGHTVRVICCSSSGKRENSTHDGVIVHRIAPGSYPLPRHPNLFLVRKVSRALIPESLIRAAWSREVALEYKQLSNSATIDIVEYPECGAEGLYLSALRGLCTVIRLHTPYSMVCRLDRLKIGRIDSKLLARMERTAAVRSTMVTSPTKALAEIVQKKWRLPPVPVIPNPLPFLDYRNPEGNQWIFVGRIEYRKGVHVLLEAMAMLSRRKHPPRLVMVGRPFGHMPGWGAYEEYIKNFIQTRNLQNLVTWIPGTDHSSVAVHMSRSRVAIIPSFWENLPYSCMEAMASGLAVVASRCGGIPELITHGVDGLLFEPGDHAGLAVVLETLLDEPQTALSLGERARESVSRRFGVSVVCPEMEQLYYRALQEIVDG